MRMRSHISWWSNARDCAVCAGIALIAILLSWIGVALMLTIPLWAIIVYKLVKAMIRVLTTDYEITEDSVVIKTGWLSIKRTELAFRDIRGICVECSFWNRLVGIGNVVIGNSATSKIDLKIEAIHRPHEFVAMLKDRSSRQNVN